MSHSDPHKYSPKNHIHTKCSKLVRLSKNTHHKSRSNCRKQSQKQNQSKLMSNSYSKN